MSEAESQRRLRLALRLEKERTDREWCLSILPLGAQTISEVLGRLHGLRDGTIPFPPGFEPTIRDVEKSDE